MLIAFILSTVTSLHAATPPPFVVVIDPGHGGADRGAMFNDGQSVFSEKDITLALAVEVSKQLTARGMQTFLTRADDSDVALPDRTKFANRKKAKLFISIHLNSTPQHETARGVETYILNTTSDASSRRLAHLENQVITDRGGESMDVDLILKDLRLDGNVAESKRAACLVQRQLTQGLVGNKNRGVKQALFHVLLGADMPSLLIEAGFLTSQADRAMVGSDHGRKSMALSIAQAVDSFRKTQNTPLANTQIAQCQVHGQVAQVASDFH